jgi:DNA-binding SARP family transcriptional activator
VITPSHTSRRKPVRRLSTGRRVWSALTGTLRWVGRVLRGLIAATVLAALVVGLPWALWHYIGWPLPDHVPTWAEIETVLLSPMTATFLLNFLTCLCWLVWAAFVIDVARCTVQAVRDGVRAARWPQVSARRPLHALAAVLVSAILLSVLGNRVTSPPPASALTTTLAGTGTPVVATAPAWPTAPVISAVAAQHPALASQQAPSATPAENTGPHTAVVRVRDPETGVYDSLSRIAERTLGTQTRWPEIFELNKGKPQPNGQPFTNPNLIFPGEELRLPPDAAVPPVTPPDQPQQPPQDAPQQPPQPPSPPTTTPPPTTPPSSTTPPTTPAPPTRPTPSAPAPPSQPTAGDSAPPASGEPAIGWGPELFVGLGLAAAVSAALVVARRRHRRAYQPGSGRRDDLDLPVAPVVYQLRLAHLRTDQDDEFVLDNLADFNTDTNADIDSDPDSRPGGHRRRPPPPGVVVGSAVPGARSAVAPGLGVRDGREIALDLAVARGLGLIGAGAPAAARALLATALTTTTNTETSTGTDSVPAFEGHLATSAGTSVLVPADDLPLLLGYGTPRAHLPRSLRLVASLDEALDELEADILRRAREPHAGSWLPIVLMARPREHNRQRLQAILDNGAAVGIVGILLGQWQAGVTAYVREDGTISATGPGVGEALRGTQVFRVGADDVTDLLDLLRRAQPETPSVDAVLGSEVPPARAGRTARAHDDTTVHVAGPGGDADGAVSGDGGGAVGDGGVVAGDAVLAADTEVEVTAVADAVDRASDAGLEIIDTHTETRAVPSPGVRLRPATPVERQPPFTVAEAHDYVRDEVRGGEMPSMGGTHGVDAVEPGDASRVPEVKSTTVPIRLTVFGQPRVHWRPHPADEDKDITGAFQPRLRELLVFLGLHPDGATRESLTAALWGDSAPEKTTNALNTALSRLRAALSKATDGTLGDITIVGEGNYRLDPALVDVDYWHFDRAVAHRRAATTPQARIDGYRDIVTTYTGPLADGMSTEWIETAREAIRRDALDAVAALARALVDEDPEQTLDLLELARAFDPHNELLYRDIMRLQERLGRLDAIPRTLTLLTTRLAEVDDRPTPQAIGLAARLQQRHETTHDTRRETPRAAGDGPGRGGRGRDSHDRSAAR